MVAISNGPASPIAAHQLLVFLLQAGLLLAAAAGLGRAAARVGLPAVVGELCAGVLLGPSILDHVAPGAVNWLQPWQPGQLHLLDAVGQIGVLLLVALTGIELDLGLVRRRRASVLCISVTGLVIPLGLGVATGYLLPDALLAHTSDRGLFALLLGIAMGVSAIPVIAKTLMDMRLLHRNVGQLTLAAGAVDDTAGWLMLTVVSALAAAAAGGVRLALSMLYLVAAIGIFVAAGTVGRPMVRRILRVGERSAGSGPAVAAAVAITLLGAAAMSAMGLEPVLGAFAAGILVGTCAGPDRAWLNPLRTFVLSVLAPLFFATAGLRMDLTVLGRPVILAAALAVLLVAIIGKFAGAYLGGRMSRLGHWEALALGAGMNARGIIEVVVAMAGLRLGLLNVSTYTIIVLVAIVTSLMAAPVLRAAMSRVEHTAEEQLRERAHAAAAAVPDGR